MTAQDIPPPPVTPYLTVDGAAAAIDFYKKAFGAVEVARQPTPDGSKIIHAAITINGGLIFLCDDFSASNPEMAQKTPQKLGGTPVTLHLDLPDVDATWKQAVAAGARVVMPLAEQFWGDRYGQIEDPFGHAWSLATRKKVASKEELDAGAKKHFT
jgi:PhnB protein